MERDTSIDIRDRSLDILTSYLYLGYTNLLLNWLRYKNVETKEDAMNILKPVILNTIKDINESPDVFKGVKAKNLEANTTIRDILLNFK